ncbi:hypothetical protein SpCBS45565_g08269 [Spizellomyces sp. 'palustris']|nr:hypothetical protein SpCBS45565_g08269 [Spizellomyces sp. 'palustris']
MSTRQSRTGTPLTNTPTLTPRPLKSDEQTPWWAPVHKWEKQRVTPKWGPMLATLGPRPGVLPKPPVHDIQIVKYVKVRKRSTFPKDEHTSLAASVADDTERPGENENENDHHHVPQEAHEEADADADADAEGEGEDEEEEEEEEEEEDDDDEDQDEAEQASSTRAIVNEDIEMLGPGSLGVTAMASSKKEFYTYDIDETLSNPLSMGMPHEHFHRSHVVHEETPGGGGGGNETEWVDVKEDVK